MKIFVFISDFNLEDNFCVCVCVCVRARVCVSPDRIDCIFFILHVIKTVSRFNRSGFIMVRVETKQLYSVFTILSYCKSCLPLYVVL